MLVHSNNLLKQQLFHKKETRRENLQCFHIFSLLPDVPLFDLRGQSKCKNTFQSITIYACLLGAARCSAEGRLIWNYSSVPDLLVSRQHPWAFSALWQTSLFWRRRQATRSPGVPPAGETPNRREGGREECFVMNSRHHFLSLKVSRLTSGVLRLRSISSKH